jgi:hypothetical protein
MAPAEIFAREGSEFFGVEGGARKFDCEVKFEPLKYIFTDRLRVFMTEEQFLNTTCISNISYVHFFLSILIWGGGGQMTSPHNPADALTQGSPTRGCTNINIRGT